MLSCHMVKNIFNLSVVGKYSKIYPLLKLVFLSVRKVYSMYIEGKKTSDKTLSAFIGFSKYHCVVCNQIGNLNTNRIHNGTY